MKRVIFMLALLLGTVCAANAQEVKNDENGNSVSQVTKEVTATSEETTDGLALQKDVYPQQGEDGDLYHGLTRKLMFDRMIPPHCPLCGFGFSQSDCGKGGRGGECHPCKSHCQKFPQRDEHVRDYGRRKFLHLQCQVRR